LVSILSALPFGQCIVCSSKEEQTMHWPKGRADNTLAKRKSRQYTDQKEEQLFLLVSVLSALPFGECIVCSSF
jgi:predicted nucleic acid-binding Zn ribbon protein